MTIIAAGPWSARLAGRAGVSMSMSLARGSMFTFEGLLVRRVVNRLQPRRRRHHASARHREHRRSHDHPRQ